MWKEIGKTVTSFNFVFSYGHCHGNGSHCFFRFLSVIISIFFLYSSTFFPIELHFFLFSSCISSQIHYIIMHKCFVYANESINDMRKAIIKRYSIFTELFLSKIITINSTQVDLSLLVHENGTNVAYME